MASPCAPSQQTRRVFRFLRTAPIKEVICIEAIEQSGGAYPDDATEPFTGQERKLIEVIRRLDYGEVRIVIKGSEIVRIEEKKSIKL